MNEENAKPANLPTHYENDNDNYVKILLPKLPKLKKKRSVKQK